VVEKMVLLMQFNQKRREVCSFETNIMLYSVRSLCFLLGDCARRSLYKNKKPFATGEQLNYLKKEGAEIS
jgi:hypothetical protein